MFARIRSLYRSLRGGDRVDSGMREEMRFHMDAYAADLVRRGLSDGEARRKAHMAFGSMVRAREEGREAMGLFWIDETGRNFRQAVRAVRRSPGFSMAVVATLALCIGANSAIFSIVDAALFRPLPYHEPDRLGEVVTEFRKGGLSQNQASQDGRTWEVLRDARSFTMAAAGPGWTGVNLGADRRASYVNQQRVSAGFLSLFGIPFAIGRDFSAAEDIAGGPRVVVLSYHLWRRAFQSDPSIVGRTILLRGEPHLVTGVTGEGFHPMVAADLWTPLYPSLKGEGQGTNYQLIARLRPGSTWPEVQTEAQAIGVKALEGRRIPKEVSVRMNILPLRQSSSAGLRQGLMILWAAVGVVLVIGCVNVAALMLSRGASRVRELGTRLALGGGMGSLLRQLTAESFVLCALGGAVGLVLGYAAIEGFRTVAQRYGVWQEVQLDLRVVTATMAVTLVTSLLVGMAPALQAFRVDVRAALSEGGSRGIAGAQSHMVRRGLVVVEVALGLVLLVGAGLLTRTLLYLQGLNPGFDSKNVVSASVSLQDARYRTPASVNRLFQQTLAEIRAMPGVEGAAVGLHVPYQRWLNSGVSVGERRGGTTMNYVTPGYFEVLRIPIVTGRGIAEVDTAEALPVTVVNQFFVRQYLDGRDPIGAEVKFGGEKRRIVGVAGNVQQRPGLRQTGPLDHEPAAYIPAAQFDGFEMAHTWFSPSWIVRTRGPQAEISLAMQSAVEKVDPLLPLASFRSLDGERDLALRSQRGNAAIIGLLAALSLVLAVVGIYGLIANLVVERTRELGIRITLGATMSNVIWSAAAPGVLLSVAGALIGAALSAGVTRFLKAFLYGVQPMDAFTIVSMAVLLIGAGLVASLIPALRLLNLNPASALREG